MLDYNISHIFKSININISHHFRSCVLFHCMVIICNALIILY